MNRITIANLEAAIKRLNLLTKRPTEPYTRIEGKLVSNLGNYHLSGAYGGWQLHEMANDGGGINVISSGGYVSKSQLYDQVQSMISYHYSVNKE